MPTSRIQLTSDPLDVWYTICPVAAASGIAAGRGALQAAFEGTGVNLRTVRTHAERAVREAHYDQTQANLFREGGNVPPLWARSLGRDVRLLGATQLDRSSLVVALPEARIRDAGDLKGKRLGIIRRPNDQIDHARAHMLRTYLTALEEGGVARGDVTFVDIVVEKAQVESRPDSGALSNSAFSIDRLRAVDGLFVKALFQGHVDAIVIAGARTSLLALLGAHVVFDTASASEPHERAVPTLFTVKGELLASHPDVVTTYVLEVVRNARWALANPTEAHRYIARDTGLTEEEAARAFGPAALAKLEPSLSPAVLAAVEHQKDFLLREGFLEADFAIRELIAPEPLSAVRKLLDSQEQRAA